MDRQYKVEMKICAWCGKEYPQVMAGRGKYSTTCSDNCKHRAAYQPKKPKAKICVICGKVFMPDHGLMITCSDECRKEKVQLRQHCVNNKKKQETVNRRSNNNIQKTCLFCKKEFETHLYFKVYCSKECSLKAHRKKSNYFLNRSRRIRLITTIQEKYSRNEVFRRDRFICHICGDPINMTLVWPDKMSASIDHVIPLNKGGTDTLDNLKAAHLSCNSKKSDRQAAIKDLSKGMNTARVSYFGECPRSSFRFNPCQPQ